MASIVRMHVACIGFEEQVSISFQQLPTPVHSTTFYFYLLV